MYMNSIHLGSRDTYGTPGDDPLLAEWWELCLCCVFYGCVSGGIPCVAA